jgi:hypothetical protein
MPWYRMNELQSVFAWIFDFSASSPYFFALFWFLLIDAFNWRLEGC